jgi:hypothetical protein
VRGFPFVLYARHGKFSRVSVRSRHPHG